MTELTVSEARTKLEDSVKSAEYDLDVLLCRNGDIHGAGILGLKGSGISDARHLIQRTLHRDKIKYGDMPETYLCRLKACAQRSASYLRSAPQNSEKRKAQLPSSIEVLELIDDHLSQAEIKMEMARRAERDATEERWPEDDERRRAIESWAKIATMGADLAENLLHKEIKVEPHLVTTGQVADWLGAISIARTDISGRVMPLLEELMLKDRNLNKIWIGLYDLTEDFKKGNLRRFES